MALPEFDAGVGHSFGLEVDGVFSSRISEVTDLKMERDVVEITEEGPDGTVAVRKLPGRWKAGVVTLTRGLTADASFAKWIRNSQQGPADDASKNGVLTVVDVAGTPIRKFLLTNAWPKSLEIITTHGSDGTATLSERLVLVCERIEPE